MPGSLPSRRRCRRSSRCRSGSRGIRSMSPPTPSRSITQAPVTSRRSSSAIPTSRPAIRTRPPTNRRRTDLHTNFAAGNLYGRQIELHSTSDHNPGPGNFGFLRTPLGNGANVMAEALATGNPGACYTQDSLDTKTGAMAGPVEDGLNTRFGFYSGSFNNDRDDGRYRPAQNVRSAHAQSGRGSGCGTYTPVMVGSTVGDVTQAVPLGYGAAMTALGGGRISSGNNWQYGSYWGVAQGGTRAIGRRDPQQLFQLSAASYGNAVPALRLRCLSVRTRQRGAPQPCLAERGDRHAPDRRSMLFGARPFRLHRRRIRGPPRDLRRDRQLRLRGIGRSSQRPKANAGCCLCPHVPDQAGDQGRQTSVIFRSKSSTSRARAVAARSMNSCGKKRSWSDDAAAKLYPSPALFRFLVEGKRVRCLPRRCWLCPS